MPVDGRPDKRGSTVSYFPSLSLPHEWNQSRRSFLLWVLQQVNFVLLLLVMFKQMFLTFLVVEESFVTYVAFVNVVPNVSPKMLFEILLVCIAPRAIFADICCKQKHTNFIRRNEKLCSTKMKCVVRFSPLCFLMCTFNLYPLGHLNEQNVHANFFSSPPNVCLSPGCDDKKSVENPKSSIKLNDYNVLTYVFAQ